MSQKTDTKLDAPEFTAQRIAELKAKPSLKAIYDRNYAWFKGEVDKLPEGKILELGSGAGYLQEVIPDLITSDILELPNCDMVARAEELPFNEEELAGILMMDVLHHIPNNAAFLQEAQRTLKPGGKIIMIEPANTPWGRFIYQNFHHEPFEPQRKEWKLAEGGPLSEANGALPWIVFQRDQDLTKEVAPALSVQTIQPFMPMAYLVSGGFSYRSLLPFPLFKLLIRLEAALPNSLQRFMGMFYKMIIVKN